MSLDFKLTNGQYFISTETAGGLYNAMQLRKLADLCDEHDSIVKATEDQRLALFVAEGNVDATVQSLKTMGLSTRPYQSGIHQPVACVGELCPFSQQDALGLATDLSNLKFDSSKTNALKIGINGCGKMCVATQTMDIAITGDEHGYRISLGGKTTAIAEVAMLAAESVPAEEIPQITQKIIELFQEQAHEGETLHELMERIGTAPVFSCLGSYSQDSMMDISTQFQDSTQPAFDISEVQINQSAEAGGDFEEIPIHDEEQASAELDSLMENLPEEKEAEMQNLEINNQLEAELESAIAEHNHLESATDGGLIEDRDNLLTLNDSPTLSLVEDSPIEELTTDDFNMEILPMEDLEMTSDVSVSKVYIDTAKQQLVVRYSDASEFKVGLSALNKAKKFHFQDSEIKLRPDHDHVCVEVDGIEFNLTGLKKAA